MEVYAGFSENADHNVGRVINTIAELGELDNTLIIWIWGDNGASMEGTITGSFNELTMQNGIPLTDEMQIRLARSAMLCRRARLSAALIWARVSLAAAAGSGGLSQQLERVRPGQRQLGVGLQRGREVLPQRRAHPQPVPGPCSHTSFSAGPDEAAEHRRLGLLHLQEQRTEPSMLDQLNQLNQLATLHARPLTADLRGPAHQRWQACTKGASRPGCGIFPALDQFLRGGDTSPITHRLDLLRLGIHPRHQS